MAHFSQRLSALALAALFISGCAPTTTATPIPTIADAWTSVPTQVQTVSWMVRGDPAETQAFQDVADAFEAANSGVQVELITLATGEDEYFARLGADLAAGTPADVVYIGYLDAARYYANGALQPLTQQLAASDVIATDDFYAPALAAYTWQGEQMCLPINLSSLVVYYNRDLFDAAGLAYPAAGWTWDEFLATAQALTRDTDGDGATDQFGLGTAAQLVRALPFIWQNGGELLDAQGDLALDTPAALEALTFFTSLHSEHKVAPGRVEEAAESSQSRFENGTLGMFLQSRRVTVAFRQITAFDWDVAPLPVKEQAATILHSDGLCIPTEAAHPALAWRLIEFASSAAGMRLMAATGRTVPPVVEVAESAAFLDPTAKPANSRVWLDAVPGLRPGPMLPEWERLVEVADHEIERAFYGETTAAAALDAIVAATTPLVDSE